MKNFTNIEQSKVLAKILLIESADMTLPFTRKENNEYIPGRVVSRNYIDVYNDMFLLPAMDKDTISKLIRPCWSLAALLDVLPNNEHVTTSISRGGWQISPVNYLPNTWWCEYEDNENLTEFNVSADNPVDACYKMILKLKERNLI